jgi:SET domain-containing protein
VTSKDKSGFCIPYTVRDTANKGRGVFADSLIRKDTILWRHIREQYAVYDEHSLRRLLATLSPDEVVYELTHMFGLPEFPGFIIRVFDDGVLINHSQQANVAMNNTNRDQKIPFKTATQDVRGVEDALLDERFSLIAKQDLEPGDELTMDYNIGIEDPPYFDALYEHYGISEPWL